MLAPEIFKANDVRGVVGAQWDCQGAWAVGRAYAQLTGEARIVVARDMRVTGPAIQAAFSAGAAAGGTAVVDAGLSSTDGLWFASGRLDLPGVQITASHNPSDHNGMKFCLRGARPVTGGWLRQLADLALAIDACTPASLAAAEGTPQRVDLLEDYVEYLLSLVDLRGMRRLKVVVDAGNGMAGLTVPAVFSRINVELFGLYLDLDGTFPNHRPNPLEPENLCDAQRAVRAVEADLAIVFDGDADRAFVIDETAAVVSPSAITALIAVQELAKEPGAAVIVNTITSAGAREIIEEHGGIVATSKVGHTYMKALMASRGAIFGGEHSAHYYFRDFFGADTGMLAALHVLAALAQSERPLSQLAATYTRYFASGEINSVVSDQDAAMTRVAAGLDQAAQIVWDDGVKISGEGWWVSLRPSNTEAVLRLNVEAREESTMARLRDSVLRIVKEE